QRELNVRGASILITTDGPKAGRLPIHRTTSKLSMAPPGPYVRSMPVVALIALLVSADGPEPRVLVMPWSVTLRSEHPPVLDEVLAHQVTEHLPEHRVVGMRDVEALLDLELAKDLIGCDDVACTAEIGLALDADLLVRGSLGTVGRRVIALLKLIDTQEGVVLRRVERSMPVGGDTAGLVERLVQDLFRPRERKFTLQLPGRSYEQWSAKVQRLAYGGVNCDADPQCYESNADAIRFLLDHRQQPEIIAAHRPALEARAAELQQNAERLREEGPVPPPTAPRVTVIVQPRPVVAPVVRVPPGVRVPPTRTAKKRQPPMLKPAGARPAHTSYRRIAKPRKKTGAD
ncbi:MAG: hypothetical protein AAFU77_17935, partial [Myxococcota bacterium]